MSILLTCYYICHSKLFFVELVTENVNKSDLKLTFTNKFHVFYSVELYCLIKNKVRTNMGDTRCNSLCKTTNLYYPPLGDVGLPELPDEVWLHILSFIDPLRSQEHYL